MLPLLTLLLSGALAAAPAPADKADPPAQRELFAKEDWYKNQAGKEETFEGTLQRIERPKGVVGFGRFNPYRLVMKGDTREVYVGSQGKLLDPYVGKRIRLTGKAVTLEVEGRTHREIWPARLELLSPAAGDSAPAGRKVKILAQAPWPYAQPNPAGTIGKDQGRIVVRSEDELVKASNLPADGRTRIQVTQFVQKALKVDAVDFKQQMLVIILGGTQPSGGFRVEVNRAEMDETGKLLVLHATLHRPDGPAIAVLTHPAAVVLLDRFDGEVRVSWKPAADKPPPPPPADVRDAPGRGVTIHARVPVSGPITPPQFADPAVQQAIRSREELVRVLGSAESADRVIRQLQVDTIDFKKHMLLFVTGGARRTGGYRLEVVGVELEPKSNTLLVLWKQHAPRPDQPVTNAITHPGELLLVDRHDGQVRFVPAK